MLDHIRQYRQNMLQGYVNTDPYLDIIKSEDNNELIKGKAAAPVGTKKEIGGRMYIKTTDGWKYFGKGGGKKAQEHHEGTKKTGKVDANEHVAKQEDKMVDHRVGIGSKVSRDGKHGEVVAEKNGKVKIKHQDEAGNTKTSVMPKEHLEGRVKEGSVQHQSAEATDEDVDINKRFEAFGRFVRGVINGRMKSMIAYGSGGVGKTYTVTQQLKAAGKKEFNEETMDPGSGDYDYVKITGKATAAAVYQAMYEHNGKILLFDDCDSALESDDAVNLFKGALDTSGDGTISWGSAKKLKDGNGEEMPSRFKFDGRVMFISNLPPDKIPQPIKSRGFRVDLTMNPEQTIERIRTIAQDKSGKYQNLKFPGIDRYSHEDLKGVVDFLDKHKYRTSDLNVRTIGALLGIKQEAEADGVDWKEDAEHMLFSKAQMIGALDPYNNIAAQRQRLVKALNSTRKLYSIISKSEEVQSYIYKGALSDAEEQEQAQQATGMLPGMETTTGQLKQ